MNKVFFFLAAGAMGFTACTSEDVVSESVQANAIGFQNVVTKESRVVTTDNFAAFHVYGYYTKTVEGSADPTVVSVFNDETITKNESGAWTYANTRYWVPGARYFFYAYSCDNQEAPTGTASFDLTGKTTAARALGLDNYVLHNHDLVYAYQEGGDAAPGILGKESDNDKVSLNFSHILTRVRATFKSDFAPGYQIKVSNVKLVGVRNEGNFSPKPSFAWSSVEYNPAGTQPEVALAMYVQKTDGQPDKTLDVATAAVPAVPAVGTEGEEGYVAGTPAVAAVDARTGANYVIPFKYVDNTVKLVFDIDVMDADGNVVYEQTITGTWKPDWVLGKAYNYVITISGTEAGLEPIEFAVVTDAIDAWGTADDMIPGDGEENIDMTFSSTAKN
ncbi:MAG: fimbrillin family protein [Duncaniella sp.]|nr:fimbrillin family protein [Duncaniella sp.]